MNDFYFLPYEDRKPPEPVPHSLPIEMLWQFLAVMNLCIGLWYIVWRWQYSLNYEALWFAIPLALAETLALFGMLLFTINLWMVKDCKQTDPPTIAECIHRPPEFLPEKISVDVFFPTYNEDPELVRLSIRDAKKITYPHPADIRIHVLDDGKRQVMKAVADEEGVNYITRNNNIGFKAGNLQNAMKQTDGDFILICDADTRPFPTILEHTMGYFRDPDVAWVQTPQWFYDIPAGKPLPDVMKKYMGRFGFLAGKAIEKCIGPVIFGKDPFANDPQMFYDVIQRRRNWANGAFCCGAGSVHRREVVQLMALRNRGFELEGISSRLEKAQSGLLKHFDSIEKKFGQVAAGIIDREFKKKFSRSMHEVWRKTRENVRNSLNDSIDEVNLFFLENPIPYKHHVSEDMYTSLCLHSERIEEDSGRKWKSVLHPGIESRMLSTQDLLSWAIQRFKYAAGTLDVAWREKHLFFKKGLSFPQKIMYGATFWSYLGCLWNVIFLTAPMIWLFSGIPPVSAYSADFFKHFFPFMIINTLAMMVGTWGVPSWSGQSTYLSFFSFNIKALWAVMKKEKRRFPRIPAGFQGLCIMDGKKEEIVVKNINRFCSYGLFGSSGMRIAFRQPPSLFAGDEIIVEFHLNDKKKTLVREEVIVKNLYGEEAGVEIKKRDEEKIKFTVTPKIRQDKNFVRLVIPQILVLVLTLIGIIYAWILFTLGVREDTSALVANTFWGMFNMASMLGIVKAAFWKPEA